MKNNREAKLWREISWRDLLLAGFITIILAVGYFYVAGWGAINNTWREFLLNIIANLIPTPLLFIVAYVLFHRIEELHTERDTDVLAEKIAVKFFQILSQIQENATNPADKSSPLIDEDSHLPLDMKLRYEFDVVAKPFDPKLNPQKIVVSCTYRGSDNIYIKKITYHGSNLIAKEHLSDRYALDGFNAIISEEQVKISSGTPYTFDLILAKTKKWRKSEIEGWYKKLGYLFFDIEYNEQVVNNIQKGI